VNVGRASESHDYHLRVTVQDKGVEHYERIQISNASETEVRISLFAVACGESNRSGVVACSRLPEIRVVANGLGVSVMPLSAQIPVPNRSDAVGEFLIRGEDFRFGSVKFEVFVDGIPSGFSVVNFTIHDDQGKTLP
jgi:hypothetical protein